MEKSKYNVDELRATLEPMMAEIIDSAVSRLNLENSYIATGKDNMSYKRIKATFRGKQIYLCGRSYEEMLENILPTLLKIVEESEKKQPVKTFREVSEEWFNIYHKNKVKHNTAYNDYNLLKNHLYPAFGDIPVDKITRDMIQDFFNSKADCSNSMCQKMKIRLNEVLRKAYDDGLVDKNVADYQYVISKKETKRDALSEEDLADIVANLYKLKPIDRALIMIPVYSGIRRGEMFGLKWSDVDFDNNLIHIERGVVFVHNKPEIGLPKSNAGIRVVPLMPKLKEFFLSLPKESEFVIHNKGVAPVTESFFQRAFQRIKKTIDLHGATEHIFRHTFASNAEPVIDPKTLQTIMGHSDIQTTMNTYAHSSHKNIISAGVAIADVFHRVE